MSDAKADPGVDEPIKVREVTLGELDRRASQVIARVRAGELAVVSRHGSPVAVILPLREAIAWLPPRAVLEGEARALARRFARREFRRAIGRLPTGAGTSATYRPERR